MWCINDYLNAHNKGCQPALSTGRHAVTPTHVEAAEHAFLHRQDLVHVVQQLYGQLVELPRVVVTNPYECLLVHREVPRKFCVPTVKVQLLDQ